MVMFRHVRRRSLCLTVILQPMPRECWLVPNTEVRVARVLCRLHHLALRLRHTCSKCPAGHKEQSSRLVLTARIIPSRRTLFSTSEIAGLHHGEMYPGRRFRRKSFTMVEYNRCAGLHLRV